MAGGRPIGSVNNLTQEARAAASRSPGRSMLQILIDNARRLEQIAEEYQAVGDKVAEVGTRTMLAQVADRAAKYLHAPQMAIKHEHTMVDGKPIKPVIEITGYPQPGATQPAPKPLPAPIVAKPAPNQVEGTKH